MTFGAGSSRMIWIPRPNTSDNNRETSPMSWMCITACCAGCVSIADNSAESLRREPECLSPLVTGETDLTGKSRLRHRVGNWGSIFGSLMIERWTELLAEFARVAELQVARSENRCGRSLPWQEDTSFRSVATPLKPPDWFTPFHCWRAACGSNRRKWFRSRK